MPGKDIRQHPDGISSSAMSRIFKCIRLHGIIERINGTYKYFATVYGKGMTLFSSLAGAQFMDAERKKLGAVLDTRPRWTQSEITKRQHKRTLALTLQTGSAGHHQILLDEKFRLSQILHYFSENCCLSCSMFLSVLCLKLGIP